MPATALDIVVNTLSKTKKVLPKGFGKTTQST